MSQTTTRPVGNSTASRPASAHRLVVVASVVALAADLSLMAIIGTVIPPLLVFAVLTGLVIAAARRWPRVSVIALGVIALAAVAGSVPFLASDLSSPADPIAFVYAVLSGGGRLLAMIGVALFLLGRDGAVRRLAVVSVGVLVLAIAGSTVARVTTSSDGRQTDDVAVVASGFTFPEEVTVSAGAALYLDNRDLLRHTFAVEGTDIDVMLEPGVQRRLPIDLPAGTYDFLCTVPGHESMTGALEVQ